MPGSEQRLEHGLPPPGRASFYALLLLAVVFALALLFGTEPTSIVRAWSREGIDRVLIVRARLPRVLLASLAGAGLSMVGAALQALLRNALADPYLLGVSGGSALGATAAILCGFAGASYLGAAVVPACAFLGGLAATAIVYALARSSGHVSGMEILLSGIIVNSMCAAFITFAKSFGNAARTQELLFWLMGFVPIASARALLFVTAYIAIGAVLLFACAGRLNLLALGDESAAHLGLSVAGLVRVVFLACSLMVGAIVSVTGLIGFVGLIVPHAARRLVGPDLRKVFPLCMLLGAATLVGSDLAARAAFVWLGTEPPVGAVTAMIGGPFALALLRKRHRA